ncbi:MAG: succinyl-diaminopimelate desuccinylase [Alphaproteobacteria bacterium]|nr:succinyl-diaminopimelate desuccinylase [Alphaproteobacteria bacterium]
MLMRALNLAQALIACPSITPKDAGAQDILAHALKEAGFEVDHLLFGDVPNLFARYGTGGPHLCYGGHTDVVPPGDESRWTAPPFAPTIRDGVLYGRGASDMKGSVAAFAAAAIDFVQRHPNFKGSISLLITGDEEGPAVDGTVKVLEWMGQHGHIPDVALVGEPTNPKALGDEIKIGRRGSLSGTLEVIGKQGHVAYPDIAINPCARLIRLLAALEDHVFDTGNAHFPSTNLEITTIDVGNPTDNIIPARASARFNIRFNDQWTFETLEAKLRDILNAVSNGYQLQLRRGAHCFITQPGPWTDLVSQAVYDITGRKPALTTGGGTSDARFFAGICPIVEFGPVNATIHQVDENIEVKVLEDVTRVFGRILERYFA